MTYNQLQGKINEAEARIVERADELKKALEGLAEQVGKLDKDEKYIDFIGDYKTMEDLLELAGVVDGIKTMFNGDGK